ncbi:MAG: hypothetical protein IPH44_42425 [Myxococcales bacterium]|nr:hypothetical protein [Myxococcales bacterium]MBK7192948.1 hypothetical protein [Myxococcales bacterium]MBP6846137.1 hypothetical protein [Kofleriaceae bacterium]
MSTPEARFVELFKTWLVSLPHDLKIAIEAMDDENLPRSARELAVGTIMYVVSPNDFVSDRNEAVASFADDAILLRLAMLAVVADGGEDGVAFRERFSELFEGLDEDLKICRGLMGDLMTWLEGKVAGLRTQIYKGKKLALYLDNDEAREILYEDGLAFRTDYPVDDKIIGDKLKKASTVLDVMRRRRTEEQRAAG